MARRYARLVRMPQLGDVEQLLDHTLHAYAAREVAPEAREILGARYGAKPDG